MLAEIDYVRVGKRIRSVRKECFLTQDELAVQCGCIRNHLSAVETGESKPSLELIVRIAAILDSSVDYFIMDSPPMSIHGTLSIIRSPRNWSHAPAGNFH